MMIAGPPIRELFGYPVVAATPAEAVQMCEAAIRTRRPLQVGVLNAAKIVNASKNADLCQALRTCDVIFADGQAVVWASRILRRPLPERVAGIDLFENLLALANQKRYSVYLLGATTGVLQGVIRVVRSRYPNVRIVGSRDGYFNASEAPLVAADIAACKPDMLFVAITSPKKETFIAAYGHLMNVPVTHGVGGSFDIMAGLIKRAPKLWQELGMEWAFRVVQEPYRMFMRYLRTNLVFIYMVVRDAIRARHDCQTPNPNHEVI
jgi:N-acetylglucosaminyldiphosphoundecaprenol N-acetyl-beta-D-mannosaminyltransferase